MTQVTGITPEQLQEILATVIKEAKSLNPLEQKKFDEDMKQERRRAKMVASLGRAEEEAQRAKRDRCSHMRYGANMGKNSGLSAPKGAMGAEWCTSGQAYQDGTALIICERCSTTWRFKPTAEFYSVIVQNGLLGEAPPPPEMTLCNGCMNLPKECTCKEDVEQQMAAVARDTI